MNKKQQVYQTDTDVDQFEISTTIESNDTIIDDSSNQKGKEGDSCIYLAIIIGFLLFVIGFVDAFALFYIPYKKYKENKQNFKDAQFHEISKIKIVLHFILNGLVSLYGFGVFFPLCIDKCYGMIITVQMFIPFILFTYFTVSINNVDYYFRDFDLNIDDLLKLINNNPPVDFIKVNYLNSFSFTNNNFKTFDNSFYKSIEVPISTNLTSKPYTYNDFPDVFYIDIIQEINMSDQLSSFFINVLNVSNNAGSFNSRNYLVSKHKKVSYLSRKTRDWSYFFGVGIYYHIYSISVPYMSKKVYLDANMIPDFNYSSIL